VGHVIDSILPLIPHPEVSEQRQSSTERNDQLPPPASSRCSPAIDEFPCHEHSQRAEHGSRSANGTVRLRVIEPRIEQISNCAGEHKAEPRHSSPKSRQKKSGKKQAEAQVGNEVREIAV